MENKNKLTTELEVLKEIKSTIKEAKEKVGDELAIHYLSGSVEANIKYIIRKLE